MIISKKKTQNYILIRTHTESSMLPPEVVVITKQTICKVKYLHSKQFREGRSRSLVFVRVSGFFDRSLPCYRHPVRSFLGGLLVGVVVRVGFRPSCRWVVLLPDTEGVSQPVDARVRSGPVRSDRKYFVVPPHFLGCTRVPFSQNKRRKAYEDGSSRFLPRKPGTFPLRCLVCFRFRSIGGSKKAPAFIRFRRRRRGGYR